MNIAPAVAPDRLRVALVHASDLGGGAERSVVGLHRGLRELGHESTLFVGEQRTDEAGVEAIPYVRGVPGTRRIARMLENGFGWQDIYNPSFRALSRRLQADFDIVHFNSLWGSSGYADIAALPLLTKKMPGLVTLRDNWLLTGHCACFHDCRRWTSGCGECPDLGLAPAIPRDGTRFNWERKRKALRDARVEVCVISEALGRDAAVSPIIAGKRIHRIYNGIDLKTFSPVSKCVRDEYRRDFGFAPDDVVVLIAGQTVEGIREGIATQHAVAALNRLSGVPGVRAMAVGHSAERVAKLLDLPTSVLPFMAEPARMARCFQASDLCLVTSEVETFGRIAAESQACGTPVVAFGVGGIPEVVLDGVGGSIVAARDIDGLVDALSKLATDGAARARAASAGRAHVAANFDQGLVSAQYAELYRDVVRRAMAQ